MKRNQKAAAVLLAIVLFGCGAIAGALADHFYTPRVVSARTAEDFRHRYVSEMRSRLKLTDKQVDQLEAILDDTKARVKAVRDASRPAMLRIKNEQIARVTSILTPEQVTGYQKLVAERERRAKEQEDQDHSNDDRHQHHRPPSF